MNLPSCIKKVEPPKPQKCEGKDEVAQPQQDETAPGPSGSECPSPKPRTLVQSQKEQQQAVATTSSSSGTTAAAATSEEAKQPSERRSIDDARVCKICYNEELGVVFLPCGHMVACVKCAPGMTTCAVCREPVAMTVRAFFS